MEDQERPTALLWSAQATSIDDSSNLETPLSIGGLKQAKLVRTCSIWRALDVIGDLPTLLILESIWLQTHRFSQIQKRTRLPKATVSSRLQKLQDARIVRKRPCRGDLSRFEYLLSDTGLDLYWVTLMLHRWEQRWSRTEKDFRVALVHGACGHPTLPTPICGHCHEEFGVDDLIWEPGPGLGLMQPNYMRRRLRRELTTSSDNALLFTDSAELLGDRWCALVLRSLLTGVDRYDQILEDTGIATNILSERLKWLSEFGVIDAIPVGDNYGRKRYRLTDKGNDFCPVLIMLQAWGDRHYAAPEGPPVVIRHRHCGAVLEPIVACSHCKESMSPGDTQPRIADAMAG